MSTREFMHFLLLPLISLKIRYVCVCILFSRVLNGRMDKILEIGSTALKYSIDSLVPRPSPLSKWRAPLWPSERGCSIDRQTFCKSSYFKNKTLGSSLCFHQSRTWSDQKLQVTVHDKNTNLETGTKTRNQSSQDKFSKASQ